jgi:hypothetical protein
MTVLIVVATVTAVGYYIVSLKRWPETKCRRCGGGGLTASKGSVSGGA